MKRIFLLVFIFGLYFANYAQAQTQRVLGGTQVDLDNNAGSHVFLTNASGSLGINTTSILPNTCALLDLSSTTKGFLVPRMNAAQEILLCGGTPPEGLITYNTTTHTFDVYNGTSWGATGWALSGNTGTNPATNFLGTNDVADFVIRTHNLERARFLSGGNLGLSADGNPFTPQALLHVGGTVPSTTSNGTTNVRINTLAGVSQTSPALTAQDGFVIAGTNGDLKKYSIGQVLAPSYADFYALMPGDNPATVAPATAVQFPQNGPTDGSGVITRVSASMFNLSAIGTYEVYFQVSVNEPGQLMLRLNGVEVASTVSGRATGTSQIGGMCLVTTSASNSTLELVNPSGNPTALTITPVAGGTHPASAHLVIKRLQ
ncbi:MAG: hypothetical protein Q8916_12500 [Bacteroidota bacterium]|nr:hypothetical protein [Bacteroidota bacterium]MDP4235072.1 hypothetical protein [Bacteroidota bacterium]